MCPHMFFWREIFWCASFNVLILQGILELGVLNNEHVLLGVNFQGSSELFYKQKPNYCRYRGHFDTGQQ